MFSSRRGQLGIVIFVVTVLLVIAVVLLVIFLHGRDEVRPSEENVSKVYYNITVASNAGETVNYELSNGSSVLLKGLLFPDAVERFQNGIEGNTTVNLSAWSDQYYWNVSVCNVSRQDFPCVVGLKRKASDYVLELGRDYVMIDPRGGVLQAPVLFCWEETGGRQVAVLMGLNLSKVPSDFLWKVDFCYIENNDVVSLTRYPITVHLNPFVNESSLLRVVVRDYEVAGHQNVGDRDAGVLI